jgi:glucose/arabinose dehydrogenase
MVIKMKYVFLSLIFCSFARAEIHLDQIKLPPGFKISIFATGLKNPRQMTWGAKGTLFVGTRDNDKVYAVDSAGKVYVLASGLTMPNGVAFRNGDLYVAEVSRILKFKNIEENLSKPPTPEVIYKDYPKDKHHGWKFIAFGPDGKLYVPVGAPCNICEPKDPYASITRMNPDGSEMEVIERGIRNSVGFDWHPSNHELWFTDNGRDLLGDDLPPDELNHAPKVGMNFGYPYCHGGDLVDPDVGKGHKCSDYVKPVQKLGAHVASLGMTFYTGKQFPDEYKNQIFITEHGSWNRSKKSGYRVTLVKIDSKGRALSYEPFATGWLQGENNWGRPVDVLNAPDGSLLVSDDFADVIYKIQR